MSAVAAVVARLVHDPAVGARCAASSRSASFPLRVCFISGSRVSAAFFVELGAAMIVASTIVPGLQQQPLLFQQPPDLLEHLLRQPVLLEKMAKPKDRRLVRNRVHAKSTRAKRRIDSLS